MEEISKKFKSIKIGRVDIFIGAAVVVIGVALFLVFLAGKRLGDGVVVSVDGRVVEKYSLFEEVDTVIEGVDGGTNRLIIKDGQAWIEEASCPDKLCVHQGKIKHITESLVCLPNRVVVRIIGATNNSSEDLDAVVK